ncbi:MAG: hypothetical protein JRJ78_15585 [Deltaproteobacteria bacterium]|nr:hypothetical protein [Deltaproteobacteria bacterium]
MRHPAHTGQEEIRISAPACRQGFRPLGDVPLFENLPAEQRTAQAGMLRINGLGDILAVESGYGEGRKRGGRWSFSIWLKRLTGNRRRSFPPATALMLYGVEFRYPGVIPEPSQRETEDVILLLAKKVHDAVRDRLERIQ